mmetsp:Transcript_20224/g.62322  ORF Transcript_20224/g.62322 Transcript_20224/m.62322 type:complete len:278 (-) Transcript_20224:322-1155(-)
MPARFGLGRIRSRVLARFELGDLAHGPVRLARPDARELLVDEAAEDVLRGADGRARSEEEARGDRRALGSDLDLVRAALRAVLANLDGSVPEQRDPPRRPEIARDLPDAEDLVARAQELVALEEVVDRGPRLERLAFSAAFLDRPEALLVERGDARVFVRPRAGRPVDLAGRGDRRRADGGRVDDGRRVEALALGGDRHRAMALGGRVLHRASLRDVDVEALEDELRDLRLDARAFGREHGIVRRARGFSETAQDAFRGGHSGRRERGLGLGGRRRR